MVLLLLLLVCAITVDWLNAQLLHALVDLWRRIHSCTLRLWLWHLRLLRLWCCAVKLVNVHAEHGMGTAVCGAAGSCRLFAGPGHATACCDHGGHALGSCRAKAPSQPVVGRCGVLSRTVVTCC